MGHEGKQGPDFPLPWTGAFLAAAIDENRKIISFKGFDMEVFPDALDEGANQDIGYMRGASAGFLPQASKSLGSISSIPTLQGPSMWTAM